MKPKKVNQDPFSNGSDHRAFVAFNCDRCIKSSQPRDGGDGLVKYINEREDGMPRCSIQRDIMTRMFSNEPIKQETIDVCMAFIFGRHLCPYRKTEYPKRKKKDPINQQKLEL